MSWVNAWRAFSIDWAVAKCCCYYSSCPCPSWIGLPLAGVLSLCCQLRDSYTVENDSFSWINLLGFSFPHASSLGNLRLMVKKNIMDNLYWRAIAYQALHKAVGMWILFSLFPLQLRVFSVMTDHLTDEKIKAGLFYMPCLRLYQWWVAEPGGHPKSVWLPGVCS